MLNGFKGLYSCYSLVCYRDPTGEEEEQKPFDKSISFTIDSEQDFPTLGLGNKGVPEVVEKPTIVRPESPTSRVMFRSHVGRGRKKKRGGQHKAV